MDDIMKKTPKEIKICERLQPGKITLSGFMGTDKRDFTQIIEDDERTLAALGVTAEEIAERLQYFQKQSYDTYLDSKIIDEIYEVESDVVRGFLPCPFMHRGLFRKTITKVTNTQSGKTFTYTALSIHLIKEHHFFEGKGSPFRLEPLEVVKELMGKNNH